MSIIEIDTLEKIVGLTKRISSLKNCSNSVDATRLCMGYCEPLLNKIYDDFNDVSGHRLSSQNSSNSGFSSDDNFILIFHNFFFSIFSEKRFWL